MSIITCVALFHWILYKKVVLYPSSRKGAPVIPQESNMLYAVVCTQGHMKLQDIKNECLAQKWVPLVVFRQDGKTILPLFESVAVARRFSERNLSKKWLTGAVNLDLRDGEIIRGKSIECVVLHFPKKLKGAVEFDIEIHEYDPDEELEVRT